MNPLHHPRILSGPRAGLSPLSDWLAASRAAGREVSVRAAFKIGRDIAEALVCLHLVGVGAGRVDLSSIHVDEAGEQAYLCPVETAGKSADTSAEHRVTHAADLAQLGRVLFELCTRRALRPAEDFKHLRAGFALVSLTNPRVPAEGDALIGSLLAPAPGRRHERAKPVFDELRRIVAALDSGMPSAAAPVTPVAPETKSMLGRKIEELLAGWSPAVVPPGAAEAPAPSVVERTAAHPVLRRVAGAFGATLLLLKLIAPVPEVGASPAPRIDRPSVRAARPADRAELARRIVQLKSQLRSAR